ncbi:hypothetical protein [Ruania alba]|uniref:Uncharacterized protein n=1 Tax=Ruania alba TaxID=648782 RepID=A0A1H5DXV9_9MICO|nr:hypothetical protein [Ruania alba]SED83711.1 hypothetical protein SAMN04488554_0831 [Ruania alba]
MIGALIAFFAAIVAAGAVLLALVSRRVPEEGLGRWLRESFAGSRADDAESESGVSDSRNETSSGPIHVGDLMGLGEDGPAYHRPVDLRTVVRGRPR